MRSFQQERNTVAPVVGRLHALEELVDQGTSVGAVPAYVNEEEDDVSLYPSIMK
jgi:hypothetical protein